MTVIDLGVSNLKSVVGALEYCDFRVKITAAPSEISEADSLVLPGVGSFSVARERMRQLSIDHAILEHQQNGEKKILGICLGMQLMTCSSTENGLSEGLGLIPAHVDRLQAHAVDALPVPHIGFNTVLPPVGTDLFTGLGSQPDFYFLHSYGINAIDALPPRHIALSEYGTPFASAFEKWPVFATQFHPEKSHVSGLRILRNFRDIQ